MKKNIFLFLCIALIIGACESNQQKAHRIKLKMADSIRVQDSLKIVQATSLGMWQIGHYVDEFKEPTKSKYITNSEPIFGTFSNSASEGANLKVDIIVDEQSFLITLYEYAGNNPVKEGLEFGYDIKVKYGDNEIVELEASNYSNRLSLDLLDAKKLKEIVLKGGTIKFSIVERTKYSGSPDSYHFVIEDASGFTNAYKKLIEL